MAIGDLTAEQQVMQALLTAQAALLIFDLTDAEREQAVIEIREAVKRVQEATHA